ncbi:MAG: hypothetical protein ACLGHC_00775 [Alphaproteobacteria bacterium]
MKVGVVAGVAFAALLSASAHAQSTRSLAEDAAAFGARDAVSAARLSPDGSSVLYVTPGPGPKTFAVISNLQTGKSHVVTSADGQPERLQWCNYSAPDRLVCSISGIVDQAGPLVSFQRLIGMNADGSDPKLLGQPSSHYDASFRQYDGWVLDWRGARDGVVLMERDYIPEQGRKAIQTRLARSKSGLAVDEVDTRTARPTTIEPPRDSASGYMTDGRGNVRIMTVWETVHEGSPTTRLKYFYRTRDSREWKTLADFAHYEDQIKPLAIDADIDAVYALKKKNGRQALYTIKLDGTLAEKLIGEDPRVDIDGAIRIGDGQRVIGYTYADETRKAVYFRSGVQGAGELPFEGPTEPALDRFRRRDD